MKKCEECKASPEICNYCINNKKDKNLNYEDGKDSYNKKIIYYKEIPDDNTSKKICSECKKVYIGYPAISRKDNKTLICSECGMKEIQEPFEEIKEEFLSD